MTTSMSCEEAVRLLLEHLDGELDPRTSDAVDRHLRDCRGCGSRAEFERRLRAELGTLRTAPVERAFERRIRDLVARFPLAGSVPG